MCVCLWSQLLCLGPSHDRGKAGGGGRSAGRGGVQRRGPQSGGGNAYNQSAGQAYVSFLSPCQLCFLCLLFSSLSVLSHFVCRLLPSGDPAAVEV